MASSTMALARAFTKRTRRNIEASVIARGGSVRHPTGTIDRNLISLPTELISTTNVHALTAPDIRNISTSSSSSSINSNNDSEFSTIDRSFLSTPGTSAETSSVDSSPVTPITPMDEYDGNFFDKTPARAATTAGNRTSSSAQSLEVPAVPKRALSHSKKAHVELSRKRSIQRMSPPPATLTEPAPVPTSADIFSGAADPHHPFGNELAQVNEVAEEFGAVTSVYDEEEQELRRKGLMKFGVEDYLDEIAGLYGGVFEGRLGPMASPWV